MQVWNVIHASRWKYRTQKWCKKSPSAHHRTTLSGYIFAIKAYIDNRKKNLLSTISPPHVFTICGWDRFVSLGHTSKFQRFRVLAALLHGTLLVGVGQTAALNRGRHLHLAGRPSRWALPTFLVWLINCTGLGYIISVSPWTPWFARNTKTTWKVNITQRCFSLYGAR